MAYSAKSRFKYTPLLALALTLMASASLLHARDIVREIDYLAGPGALCHMDPDDVFRERLRYEAVKDRTNKGFLPPLTADRDVNNVAVVEDDGTVILPPNPFDLGAQAIRFAPGANGYAITSIPATLDGDYGRPVRLTDDDTRNFNLGFSFPFYGRSYDNIWLNSDGNLTFTVGDTDSSTPRDAFRHLVGPPRISPFLQDLNPEDSGIPLGGGVFARLGGDRAVFTWDRVPLYRAPTGRFVPNTFQVVIYSNGTIDIVYAAVEGQVAVVGLSPGGQTNGRIVKFRSDLPLANVGDPVYEEFRLNELLSFIGLVKKFYRTHSDTFDFVILFTNFQVSSSDAFAFKLSVANHIKGIGYRNRFGRDLFDFSSDYGSLGRLSAFVFMFSERQYPDDPYQIILGTNNTLSVLGQEVGHRWGSFVGFRKDGARGDELLGRDFAHWSFFNNSLGSHLEGNEWRDDGGGRFFSIGATSRYSPLDQYLMGLRSKDEVPSSFVITGAPGYRASSAPRLNVNLQGQRLDVSIDDIIAFEGSRMPDADHSQKTFTGAFVLLTKNGEAPSQAALDKIARIRSAWEPFFYISTDGRGAFYTQVDGRAPEGGTPTVINFPYWGQGPDNFTALAITNRSNLLPATLSMTAYDDNGRIIDLPGIQNAKTFSVLPQMQLAKFNSDVFGVSSGATVSGWVQATVSNNEVSSFFLTGGGNPTRALDGAVAHSDVSTNLVFTRILEGTYIGQSASTELYVANPNNDPADVTLTFYSAAGAALGTYARTAPGHGRIAGSLRTLFPTVAFPQMGGHVAVTGTQPLVGFEINRYRTEISSLSAQAPNGAVKLYSAHYASGKNEFASWFTDFNLVNTTNAPITVTLTLIGDDGQPISGPGITNPVRNRAIAAHAALTGSLSSIFGFPEPTSDSALRTGSIIVEAGAPGLVGDVLFGEPNRGSVMSSLPMANRLVTEAVFSQVALGLGFFTGLAVVNPNVEPVNLTVSVFSADGLLVGRQTLTMAPGTRFARLLDDLVAASRGQVGGYIHVRSEGGGVALFEIFGDVNSSNFNAAVPPQIIER